PGFYASFFPKGPFSKELQGGTLFVRKDGVQINASIYTDGSLLWAFTHPDGRSYRRRTNPDGTLEYSAHSKQ
ncbi:MAG: hypothetical protein AAB250_10555, partial [Bdellovibrionota bacterium]